MSSVTNKLSAKTDKYAKDLAKLFGNGVDVLLKSNGVSLGVGSIMAKVYSMGKELKTKEKQLPVNPYFIEYGHADTSDSLISRSYLFERSQLTRRYNKQSRRKKMAGEAIEIVGSVGGFVGSIATAGAFGTNVGSCVKHSGASVSSMVHFIRFKSMVKNVQGSRYLSELLDDLIFMKKMKTGIRTHDLAASAVGGAAGSVLSMGARANKIMMKETMGEVMVKVAYELHWRAFVELQISKKGGPASHMVRELLTRRTHQFLGGQYDWRGIIKEPCGWIVIKDKIAQV